jgi:integrase/recombinase XerD
MAPENHKKRAVPTIRCLHEDEWPEADRRAWQAACNRGSLLDEGGLAADWSASTKQTIASGYGRWLAFLLSRTMLDPLATPAERITREQVEAYLADLKANGNASGTIHIRILQLCRMLDVTMPGSRPDWLGRLLAKLWRGIKPTRDDRARPPPAATVVAMGWSLMNRAEAETEVSPRLRAVTYRDGLIVMILLASLLRVGNLAALKLGDSLIRRGDAWWISFAAPRTKGRRRPIDLPLPVPLTPMIERYLEVWRPILRQRPGEAGGSPAPDTDFLWLGRYGGKFTAKKVNKRFNEITLRELGVAMNPHLIRKLAPTELAIHDPTHVGISQPLLGHASYDTTQAYYNLGRSIDAARRVQALMSALRQPKPQD